jgi:galactokinase
MDQLASLGGEPRHALLIDFQDDSVTPVPFDPAAAGLALLLINSNAPHRHAGGEYAARRASCERAAAALGVGSLREVQDRGEAVLAGVTDPVDARRARHILTENRRVADVVSALDHADFAAVGRLFDASHASMRDDFEISCDELDAVVETAMAGGAVGARMTGGGFGGSAIALVPVERMPAVLSAIGESFAGQGWRAPSYLPARASAAARVLPSSGA